MAQFFPAGFGGSSGSAVATATKAYVQGNVWYVHHTGKGTDDGLDRKRPLKFFGDAIDVAASGDVVVLMSGHSEGITYNVNIAQDGLVVAGEGSGTSMAKLWWAGSSPDGITVAGAGFLIDNVWFGASAVTSFASTHRIHMTGRGMFSNCKFDCGDNDLYGRAVVSSGTTSNFLNCTFTSTATDTATAPLAAIYNTAGVLICSNCTFDGGDYGWGSQGAVTVTGSTAMRIVGVRLLEGSDIIISTGNEGVVTVSSATGSSIVDWTA